MLHSQAMLYRAPLLAAVTLAAGMLPKRPVCPALGAMRLRSTDSGALVSAFDGDLWVDIAIRGAALDPGIDFAMPAHLAKDLLKRSSADEVTMTVTEAPRKHVEADGKVTQRGEEGTVRVEFGEEGQNTVRVMHGADLGALEFDGAINADFVIGCDALADALSTVEFAISTEEARYYLNGIYMHIVPNRGEHELRFVATDGHRLARFDMPAPAGSAGLASIPKDKETVNGVILPRALVAFLLKALKPVYAGKGKAKVRVSPTDCRVIVNCTRVRFVIGDMTVTSKLIDGTFPDYGRIIPTMNENVLTVGREALLDLVKRVSTITTERGRAVKLGLGDFGVTVSAADVDTGSASGRIPGSFVGADGKPTSLDIGFNASYLVDILSTVRGDDVVFRLSDPNSPVLIQATDGGPQFVLMPMRV